MASATRTSVSADWRCLSFEFASCFYRPRIWRNEEFYGSSGAAAAAIAVTSGDAFFDEFNKGLGVNGRWECDFMFVGSLLEKVISKIERSLR